MVEIWRDIKNYGGRYQISNMGRVKSLGNNKTRKEKILKPRKNRYGYLFVSLCIDCLCNQKTVHRLVCNAFLPNHENKCIVNHKNGIKTDNSVENLEWSTHSENNKHAYDTGLKIQTKGKDSTSSIPICQYTKLGEYIDEFAGACEAQRKTGINQGNVIQCCKGKRNYAGGYIWKYK